MKSIITLRGEFINKIIFIPKHLNYSIHFLNIVSVRWCPLLSTHFRKHFWKFCITRCSMLGEIAATSSLVFCFKSTVVLGFFSYTLLLGYPKRVQSQALRSGDLAGHSIFLFVRSRELGTPRWGLALPSSQCEPLPRLPENRRVSVSVPRLCNSVSGNVQSISA